MHKINNNTKIQLENKLNVIKNTWLSFKDLQNTLEHVQTVANYLVLFFENKNNIYQQEDIKKLLELIGLIHDIGKNDLIFKNLILNNTKQFNREENIDFLKIHVLQAPFYLKLYHLDQYIFYNLLLSTSVLHHIIRASKPYPNKKEIKQLDITNEQKILLIKVKNRIKKLTVSEFKPTKNIIKIFQNKFNININQDIKDLNYLNTLIHQIIPKYLFLILDKNKKQYELTIEIECIAIITIILSFIDILSSRNRIYQSQKIEIEDIYEDLNVHNFLKKEFIDFTKIKLNLN